MIDIQDALELVRAYRRYVEHLPGKHNQKSHGNRYGSYNKAKGSMHRLSDDKVEREKYKAKARAMSGAGAKPVRTPGEKSKPAGPNGTPVSAALNTAKLPKGGNTAPKVREALAEIDKVHGDGALPTIPIATIQVKELTAYTLII